MNKELTRKEAREIALRIMEDADKRREEFAEEEAEREEFEELGTTE